ncbi:hypothetical protein [Alkalihalobacillus sp. BA299]|uniref:hypothetical protein n=1 Tax=Alkalihalobacillus sp. BA299 TaxID=2815938 RepID=UPI001ADBDDA1|nr:hypothetical protein [Alkalihalobacillus sp. BA299]
MSDRLHDIKNMVEAMNGDLTAQLFGYELDEKAVVDDFKWLIEQVEQLNKKVKNQQKELHKLNTDKMMGW